VEGLWASPFFSDSFFSSEIEHHPQRRERDDLSSSCDDERASLTPSSRWVFLQGSSVSRLGATPPLGKIFFVFFKLPIY